MTEPKPVTFACGLTMKNRFMLAPMTNCQSHDDGALSIVIVQPQHLEHVFGRLQRQGGRV